MEPAKIDWKRLEWNFSVDELYEHINAPKWVDFLSLNHSPLQNNNDDQAWFCKPDCNHPKTAEDFLRSPSPFKARSPFYISENHSCDDQNRRDMKIKRRGPPLSSSSLQDDKFRFKQDIENQNPNLFTPPMKSLKAGVKSSEEKKKPVDDTFQENTVGPSLKSTLSAKNLFSRRPILNQITDFCNELKKMALRARERENAENLNHVESKEEVVVLEKTPTVKGLAESDRREKERKPLLVVSKAERKPLLHRKKPDEAENMPITLDLENVRYNKENSLQQIRTNPPSPQCFSDGLNKSHPPKGSRSRLMERGILEEVAEQNKEVAKNSTAHNNRSITIMDGRDTKALDMFWFFKPCTTMSS